MRKSVIDVINSKTRSDRDIKDGKFTVSTWQEVEAKFPVVTTKKFLEGWIISFMGKKKKAPSPPAFVSAITKLLDSIAKKMVLPLSTVLDTCPLFMNRPPPSSHILFVAETHCGQ